jgi:hypothetical protein
MGLFSEYKKVINDMKNQIILGPSGTGKSFIIQQEAQSKFIINIICNERKEIPDEHDSSFVHLIYVLNSNKENEKKLLSIIYLYIISRLLYLKYSLEIAENENISLSATNFFLSQMNGNSEVLKELFTNVLDLKLFIETNDFVMISKKLIDNIKEKFKYVKDISFSIDEAGVAAFIMDGFFTSPTSKKKALLTAIISSLSLISEMYEQLFICGTYMRLIDKDTIISALGKSKDINIIYTKPASYKEQLELFKIFFNLEKIDMTLLKKKSFFTSKKRLIANTIKYVNVLESKNSSYLEILNNSLKISYKEIKNDLLERFQSLFSNKTTLLTRQYYQRAIKELIFVSSFYRSEIYFPLSIDTDQTIDLMHLGVVNQKYEDGVQKVNYIKDILIIEVCKEIFKDDSLLIKILEYFQTSLITDSIKSTTKGNNLELIILSLFLNQEFQNKPLIDLPFIKENLPKNFDKSKYEWLTKIEFKCNDFGIIENFVEFGKSDCEILKNFIKNEKHIILKPSNDMHPDGILVFFFEKKYYFLIIGDKMSWNKVDSTTHKKNLYSTDLNLFYIDNYDIMKVNHDDKYPKKNNNINESQKQFFKSFPPDQIGGVIRILFELDPSYINHDTICFKEDIFGNNVEQIIIYITKKNLNTFIIDKNIINYFINLFEFCKKTKQYEKNYTILNINEIEKVKEIQKCCGCISGICNKCLCTKNKRVCTNCASINCKNTKDYAIDDSLD